MGREYLCIGGKILDIDLPRDLMHNNVNTLIHNPYYLNNRSTRYQVNEKIIQLSVTKSWSNLYKGLFFIWLLNNCVDRRLISYKTYMSVTRDSSNVPKSFLVEIDGIKTFVVDSNGIVTLLNVSPAKPYSIYYINAGRTRLCYRLYSYFLISIVGRQSYVTPSNKCYENNETRNYFRHGEDSKIIYTLYDGLLLTSKYSVQSDLSKRLSGTNNYIYTGMKLKTKGSELRHLQLEKWYKTASKKKKFLSELDTYLKTFFINNINTINNLLVRVNLKTLEIFSYKRYISKNPQTIQLQDSIRNLLVKHKLTSDYPLVLNLIIAKPTLSPIELDNYLNSLASKH